MIFSILIHMEAILNNPTLLLITAILTIIKSCERNPIKSLSVIQLNQPTFCFVSD